MPSMCCSGTGSGRSRYLAARLFRELNWPRSAEANRLTSCACRFYRQESSFCSGIPTVTFFLLQNLISRKRDRLVYQERKDYMKLSAIFKSLLPALALLLGTSAFAASKGTFYVDESVTVSGHQLAPGQYQVKWEGIGPDVQVGILSQGKLVTTVPAHLIALSHGEVNDATVWNKNDDGTRSLQEIDFAGKKYALDFRSEPATPESMPQTDNN